MTRRQAAGRSYPPDYVSAETLAYRLDVPAHLVEILVREGQLPQPELLGSLKRWDFADVRTFLKSATGRFSDGKVEANGRRRDVYLERLKRGSSA